MRFLLTIALFLGIVFPSIAQECVSPDSILSAVPSNVTYIGAIGHSTSTFKQFDEKLQAGLARNDYPKLDADMYLVFKLNSTDEYVIITPIKNGCAIGGITAKTSIFNE